MDKQKFSKSKQLIKDDLKKVLNGFLIALGGALIAFLGDVSGLIDYSRYGQYGAFIALAISSISSSIINLLRK